MWNEIKRILAALRASIAGLVSLPLSLFEEFMSKMEAIRSAPMRALAADVPRVREARDAIQRILDEPTPTFAAEPEEAPEPAAQSTEIVEALGAMVRRAVDRLLVDTDIQDLGLDATTETYLLSLTTEDLRLLGRATDLEIGRHILGTPSVRGFGGSHLRVPSNGRDIGLAETMKQIREERRERAQAAWVDKCVQDKLDDYYENRIIPAPALAA